MNEKIKVEDESGDKKYFTIVPNIILNHSTAQAQALYLQLKRLAGENGVACCGQRYLKQQLGMSHNTIKKEFEYLLKKGWIKFNGLKEVMTDGGIQQMKSYKIVDLWKMNIEEYQNQHTLVAKGCQNEHKGVSKSAQGGVKMSTKEELLTELKNNTLRDKPALWILESKLEEMEKIPNSYLDIIASFIREKPVSIENAKQLSVVITRYCRVAKQLSGAYTNKQIFGAVSKIKEDNDKKKVGEQIDFTLETILKTLTK